MTSYDVLPPEVWMGIVNAAHSIMSGSLFDPGSPIIQNLALTSSSLYRLAQPYIYHCIKLRNTDSAGRQRSNALFDVMSEYPQRRRWIKYLTVVDSLHNDYSQEVNRFRERFSAVFLDLEDLRGLSMLNMFIVAEVYKHILELRHLQIFQPYRPTFADISGTTSGTESLSLATLNLLGDWAGNQDQDAEAISRLTLRSPQLKHLHHDPSFPPLASTLFSHQPSLSFPSLLSLDVPIPSLPNQRYLVRFLQACPNLLSLHLRSSTSTILNGAGPLVLPQSLVPKLRQYSGPLSVAASAARGRPISQIQITLGFRSEAGITRDTLYPLLASSVPITTLHLQVQWWDDGYLPSIVDLFGCLEDLAIRYQQGDYMPWSKSIVADLRPLIHLKRLELGTILPGGQADLERHRLLAIGIGTVREDTQQERVTKLAENKPSLTMVRLCHYSKWVRDGGEWPRMGGIGRKAHL